ncbi:MAG: calcium:proton antiporter, partial [Sphingobium sp.]
MHLSTLRLPLAWLTVGAVIAAPTIVPAAMSPILAGLLFIWLLGIIFWSAFGVVHEAEEL